MEAQLTQLVTNIHHQLMLITPSIAETFLASRVANRNISNLQVSKYADDMKSGKWEITHQGIAINSQGALVDGQHRLSAVIKSECSVYMWVAFGVDSKTFDQLRPRSLSDTLKMNYGVSHSTRTIAALRCMMFMPLSTHYQGSYANMAAMTNIYSDVCDYLDSHASPHIVSVCCAPVIAAIGRAYYHEDTDRLSDFCKILLNGIPKNLTTDTAALRLRNYLISNPKSGGSTSQKDKYLKAESAIYHFCRFNSISKLCSKTESIYPLPIRDEVSK